MPTFNYPKDVALDQIGNIYVTDSCNHIIRKISPNGIVTTFAGSPNESRSIDGQGSQARFRGPDGITIDQIGTLYVAEYLQGKIRKMTLDSIVTTISINSAVHFFQLSTITIGWNGDILAATGKKIYRITSSGNVTAFAELPDIIQDFTFNQRHSFLLAISDNNKMYKINAQGNVTSFVVYSRHGEQAHFTYLKGIVGDHSDNFYVTDDCTISKITPTGDVITFAGSAEEYGYRDGRGSSARFHSPEGMTIDPAGNIYVADSHNHTIRKITPLGDVTTVAGIAYQCGHEDTSLPLQAQYFSPLAESERVERQTLLHEFRHSFVPARNAMMESMMMGRIDIKQREQAKIASRASMVERILIVTFTNGNEEVEILSKQTAIWYSAKKWGMRSIGTFNAFDSEIASLWEPLNDRDTGENYKTLFGSVECANLIAERVMARGLVSAHMTRPIPPPAIDDRYRIVLIGHGSIGVGLGASPAAVATLILASIRLLSQGYPNLFSSSNTLPMMPIRVTVLSCLSGSNADRSSAPHTMIPRRSPSDQRRRPIAAPSSFSAKITRAISGIKSSTIWGSMPLTFRIKGYSTYVSSVRDGVKSGFRRQANGGLQDFYSADARANLVQGRVFSYAVVPKGSAIDESVADALSDSEDDEN